MYELILFFMKALLGRLTFPYTVYYSSIINNSILRMNVVGECKNFATEGASSKKTLGTNLSGRWNHNETHLWRARISTIRHQRGRLYDTWS